MAQLSAELVIELGGEPAPVFALRRCNGMRDAMRIHPGASGFWATINGK